MKRGIILALNLTVVWSLRNWSYKNNSNYKTKLLRERSDKRYVDCHYQLKVTGWGKSNGK